MCVYMPYVNITLDVGAAMNAYKLIWNFQERFRNVVIHLGDFHFMKENFQVKCAQLFLLLAICGNSVFGKCVFKILTG